MSFNVGMTTQEQILAYFRQFEMGGKKPVTHPKHLAHGVPLPPKMPPLDHTQAPTIKPDTTPLK